ncbi:MAG: PEP/pyruvate-binding domain-containing protein [bacterium]|nr:PEP/pyruvate-binding domain-containing protein [bacterium]
MEQGLFEVFGDGKIGLKAADLNQHAMLLESVGTQIPKGFVIATGIFDELRDELNLYNGHPDYTCPDFLSPINEAILDKMTVDTPYAIRSSALSEHGGTGIYKTTFFWPTGDRHKDLKKLWDCELAVYASEFTEDAILWREKIKALAGMAILIQPVIGFHFENYFLPALAGVAYTSYNGLPTVRAVIGLGTKAANGGGVIFNYPSDHVAHFQREMWEQEDADALTVSGKGQTHTQFEEIFHEIALLAFAEPFCRFLFPRTWPPLPLQGRCASRIFV